MASWATMSLGSIRYMVGVGRLTITGSVPHGKGEREVWLHLDDAEVAYIARVAPYMAVEPDREHRGHAVWHADNPTSEYPCDQCSEAVHAAKDKWAQRVERAPPTPRAQDKDKEQGT